ncbi:hypothetical protein PPACK8108_LOCUS4524 [Phakopsora pachyrhizi]|uniref:Uncharacterized protein n=1 Tax=Phakopsora pachyrhizi TaxID=170000 RepID=A0AAV0APX8_PHAPC|nr:hypothetical protein PPACK8108_LOCUS4524 [Phakopsora pachyrhizi]
MARSCARAFKLSLRLLVVGLFLSLLKVLIPFKLPFYLIYRDEDDTRRLIPLGKLSSKSDILNLKKELENQFLRGKNKWLKLNPLAQVNRAESEASENDNSREFLRDQPNFIELSNSSPPQIGPVPFRHPITVAYKVALEDVNAAIDWLIGQDPVISKADFRRRFSGIPGTGVRTDSERDQLQSWLDCVSAEGEWRWEPALNDSSSPTITIHKQGPEEAKCDRAYYNAFEEQEMMKVGGDRSSSHEQWNARLSLKYRWHPSSRCDLLRPGQHTQITKLTRANLCHSLHHRKILIVGDNTQYKIHDLLLDWTSTRQLTCYGSLYCNSHKICQDELGKNWNGSRSDLEAGLLDHLIYSKIPPQPRMSYHQPTDPSLEHLNSSFSAKNQHSTILRFRRSDSLWGSSTSSHSRFDPTWIHPNTGIKDINNHWLADAKRSNLIILSRPPLPMPIPSYMTKSFRRPKELRSKHFGYLKHISRDDEWSIPAHELEKEGGGKRVTELLIKMAKRMVLEVWLPEVLYTLFQLRSSSSPIDQLIVWRGEWRSHPDCSLLSDSEQRLSSPVSGLKSDWDTLWAVRSRGDGPAPHLASPTLASIIFPSIPVHLNRSFEELDLLTQNQVIRSMETLKSPRIVFHDLEVIFQNMIMKRLAPKFGIPFLDLDNPTKIWRGGMIGSSVSFDKRKKKKVKKEFLNCFQYCFPSPGRSVEDSFLGGLLKILQ